MDSITTALLVAACVFGGGLVGLLMHRLLPDTHLTAETQDVVRLGTGMLSVLASLVLGLLIATAKNSYDATAHQIRDFAAELGLLNETLRDYGGKASVPHGLLRQYTERLRDDGWPQPGTHPPGLQDDEGAKLLERVRESIRALEPDSDGQRWLQGKALEVNSDLLRQRWLLVDQERPSVQRIVIGILVSWVAVIFAGFGLKAPRNGTVLVALLLCAAAIGGAIFLILEMDHPLEGVMRISSASIDNVLASMNW